VKSGASCDGADVEHARSLRGRELLPADEQQQLAVVGSSLASAAITASLCSSRAVAGKAAASTAQALCELRAPSLAAPLVGERPSPTPNSHSRARDLSARQRAAARDEDVSATASAAFLRIVRAAQRICEHVAAVSA